MGENVRRGGDQVVQLLHDFAVASERHVDIVSSRNHLHRTDLHALDHLVRASLKNQQLTASTLGRKLGLTPAATTALIDRLQSAGYAERHRNQQDRRVIHVTVTTKARNDCLVMFSPLVEQLGAVVTEFSATEREVLVRFLAGATAAIHEVNDSDPDTGRAS